MKKRHSSIFILPFLLVSCCTCGESKNIGKTSDDLSYIRATNEGYSYNEKKTDEDKTSELALEDIMSSLGMVPTLNNEKTELTYGLYPQTHVNDPELIHALFSLESKEENGYYLYNGSYYMKKSALSCLNYNFYNGSRDWETFSDGTKILDGMIYWFKCEPIEWKILYSYHGTYSLVSKYIINAHRYKQYNKNFLEDEKGKDSDGYYPCDYKNSEIRSWLNSDFYNASFSLDSSYIQTTEVDNSAATTNNNDNKFACENTNDKIYLLSFQDYNNEMYFPEYYKSLLCQATDWAKANGARFYTYNDQSDCYGYYMTRSPYIRGAEFSTFVGCVDCNGWLTHYSVDQDCGVRPAITIKI